MDAGRQLIAKVIETKDLTSIVESGITADSFVDDGDRDVFSYIRDFNAEHGAIPPVGILRVDFPEYRFDRATEPMSFLVQEVQRVRALSILQEAIGASADAYDERDPQAAASIMAQAIAAIYTAIPAGRDVEIGSTAPTRIERYRALQDNPDEVRGIPTGFASLDRATGGYQEEHLVTLVGQPKAGKSTLLLVNAITAWQAGFRPLLFTYEMSNDEMAERLDAFLAHVSNERLRNGKLRNDEWRKLETALTEMQKRPEMWFSADSSGASTISGIGSKIDRYKPDIVFIDGVYLMSDEITGESNTPRALTNLTRGFKAMAQNRRLPVVITSQVLEWKMDKKRGITSNSIGYSSSFVQDSNTVVGVENTEDDSIKKLKIVLSRNCPRMEVFVSWDWENGSFEEMDYDPTAQEGDGDGSSFF